MVLGGRYHLDAVLGRGGSGLVFCGSDRVLGETVAIKILHPHRALDRSWIKRLFREVKIARAIRHANVCRVFELGEADGHWFVTMELASGNLRQRLEGAEQRSWAERMEDARAICNGLSAIHAVGIVHRDVTPQNILCMPDGRLVISDFGLALMDQDTTTMYGGTPNYLPPEVVRGSRSDQQSDVWQLGVVLHEVLFGSRPTYEQHGDRAVLQPPVTSDGSILVEEMARLCVDCLESRPERRPESAVAVAGRLAAAEAARPRGWVVRQSIKARSWAKRRRRSLATVLAVGSVLFLGVRLAQVAERPKFCRGAPERVAAVWNAKVKSKVAAAFQATAKPYSAHALVEVVGVLDDYVRRWTGIYVEACEATHLRGDQSAEVLDLRMGCLSDRLEEVKALAKVLSAADGTVVENSVKAAAGIRPLDQCSDVRTLRSGVQPPKDPQLRQEVDALRVELIRVRTLSDIGAWPQAWEAASTLVRRARQLAYSPLVGQALALLGLVGGEVSKGTEAYAALEEAAFIADAWKDDETLAEACALLVYVAGYVQTKYEIAEMWARRGEAVLRRSGSNRIVHSWLLNNVGVVRSAEGRHEEAVALLREAVALKTAERGPNHFDVAISLSNMAVDLNKAGRSNEAIAAADRAHEILLASVGSEHPRLAINLGNRAEILAALGRVQDAYRDLETGLTIARREPELYAGAVADMMATLGACEVAEGKTESAIATLRESIRIFDEIGGPGELAARPLFELAKATWANGKDLTEAVGFALRARKEYQRLGRTKQVVLIESWLANHRPQVR